MNATQKFRRTPKGVLTNSYTHQRARRPVLYTLAQFHARFLNDPKFLRLHKEWLESGCIREKTPTVDRINSKLGYVLGNIQILTWAENRHKQNMERRARKGVVLQYRNGKLVDRFKSQKEAVKRTGLNQALVSAVLNGKRSHTGGFQFVYEPEVIGNIYENPELLKK